MRCVKVKPNKIKGYRYMLGLTQKEMGLKLGISKETYIKRERGETKFKDNEKLLLKKMLLPLFSDITIEKIFF